MLDTLTGEQFKTLIEQFTQDGKVNTLPELFRLLSDIPEDQTLGEYIREHGVDPDMVETVVDETLDRKHADNADIDEIFPEEEKENENER